MVVANVCWDFLYTFSSLYYLVLVGDADAGVHARQHPASRAIAIPVLCVQTLLTPSYMIYNEHLIGADCVPTYLLP